MRKINFIFIAEKTLIITSQIKHKHTHKKVKILMQSLGQFQISYYTYNCKSCLNI